MRRIAHAVRGLKCIMGRLSIHYNMSHRSRGVLIEIGALISAYSLIV